MPMQRRKLKAKRPKHKMDQHKKMLLRRYARIHRAARRVANRNYYRRNHTEILRRQRLARQRHGHGDHRVSRQMERASTTTAALDRVRMRLRVRADAVPATDVEGRLRQARALLCAPEAFGSYLQGREIEDIIRWRVYPINKKSMATPTLSLIGVNGRYVAAWRSDVANHDFEGPELTASLEEVQSWVNKIGGHIVKRFFPK